MTPRRPLLVLAAVPMALAVVASGDWRMPEMLARQPAPVLDVCHGDVAGLAPVHFRYDYRDGTTSGWVPFHAPVRPDRLDATSQSVRDGLGRTTTVTC